MIPPNHCTNTIQIQVPNYNVFWYKEYVLLFFTHIISHSSKALLKELFPYAQDSLTPSHLEELLTLICFSREQQPWKGHLQPQDVLDRSPAMPPQTYLSKAILSKDILSKATATASFSPTKPQAHYFLSDGPC